MFEPVLSLLFLKDGGEKNANIYTPVGGCPDGQRVLEVKAAGEAEGDGFAQPGEDKAKGPWLLPTGQPSTGTTQHPSAGPWKKTKK